MNSDAINLLSWDTGADIATESYDRLRNHPLYPEAVRKFARNMLAGASDPAVDGIIKDAGRSVAALCAAYLHASGGLTLPRLKSLLAGFGLVSVGRTRALLIYMQYLGFVDLIHVREHRKPAVYRPTARFLKSYREHQRGIVDAIQLLEPAVGAVLKRFDAAGVYESFLMQTSEMFLHGSKQGHDQAAYYRVFMHRNAGIQIMFSLLVEARHDDFPPRAPIAFSAVAAARRFGVSRIHVQRLIEAAKAEGLFSLRPGEVVLTDAGRTAVDWVFATQMIIYLTAAARTFKAMPELLAASDAELAA
jgi:hypothetical protein